MKTINEYFNQAQLISCTIVLSIALSGVIYELLRTI